MIFVTMQQNTIMQSLSDYFNVSKFCIRKFCMKSGWFSGKSVNLLPPGVR